MKRKPFTAGMGALAVTITAPSTRSGPSCTVMKSAGVAHSPQSSTSLSAAVMPRVSAALMRAPEGRGSRPTASRSASGVVPRRSASQQAKA